MGLDVVFRPIPFDDFEQMKEAGKSESEILIARVVSWGATIGGEAAPVTAENLSRLPYGVGVMLRNLVLGFTVAGNTLEDDAKNSAAA
jgi:hypothetical protein